jgi:hypothetical protein
VNSASSLLLAIAMRRSGKANSITPPLEPIRPLSNAAVIFLRCTNGSENDSRLSLIITGMAASDPVRGWFRHQISLPVEPFTLHPPANPCLAVDTVGWSGVAANVTALTAGAYVGFKLGGWGKK